jgi:hypothetical protein
LRVVAAESIEQAAEAVFDDLEESHRGGR